MQAKDPSRLGKLTRRMKAELITLSLISALKYSGELYLVNPHLQNPPTEQRIFYHMKKLTVSHNHKTVMGFPEYFKQ